MGLSRKRMQLSPQMCWKWMKLSPQLSRQRTNCCPQFANSSQMRTSVTKLTRRLRSEEETKLKDKRPLRSQNDTQVPRGKKKRDLGMVICAEGGGGRLLTNKQKLSN